MKLSGTIKPYLIIILLSAIIRIVFIIFTPLGQTVVFGIEGLNDEPSHYNYVRYLALHKSLPVQTENAKSENAFINNIFEYYQPPLYYIACAVAHPLLGDGGTLYWGRIVSFVCGILTLIVLIKILQLLKFEKKTIILALSFASFQMSHVYFSSLLSNDSLCWLIGMLILYTLLLLHEKSHKTGGGIQIEDYVAVLLIIVGMYVKSSLVIFFPVFIVTALLLFASDRSVKALFQRILLCGGALCIISPWYIRNYLLYQSVFAFEIGFGPPGIDYLKLSNIHTVINTTVKLFFFPMQHVPVTMVTKAFNYTGCLIIASHIVLAGSYIVDVIRRDQKYYIITLIFLLSMASYVMLLTKWFNAEGRYLFAAFGPIVLMLFPAKLERIRKWKIFLCITVIEVMFGYCYFLLI